MAGEAPGDALIDPTALLQFPGWIRNAVASGRSATELARLPGTTPAAIADLVSSVPTRPADVRRLARRLGMDYESLRTLADDALKPLTGFDAETRLMLRFWQKLDVKRRETTLAILKDLAAASGRRKKKLDRRGHFLFPVGRKKEASPLTAAGFRPCRRRP